MSDNVNLVAVEQIRAVLARLGPLEQPALFAFDGGYDPVQLSVELAGTGVQIVVRVRDDRAFYARPAPRVGGRGGRRAGTGARCPAPIRAAGRTRTPGSRSMMRFMAGYRYVRGTGCTRNSAPIVTRVAACELWRAP